MKKRALRKEFYMEIRRSLGRFLSIFFIVAIGVAFFSGIRAAEPDMRYSGDQYFDEKKLMDIQVVSTLGLLEDDVQALEALDGIEKVEAGYSTDVLCTVRDSQVAMHVMSILPSMNELTVEEGRLPRSKKECVVDATFLENTEYKVGDTIHFTSGTEADVTETLSTDAFQIVGAVSSPCYISFGRGNTNIGTGSIAGFVSVLPESFEMAVYTEAYASVEGARELTAFTDPYDKRVDAVVKEIEDIKDEREDARSQMFGQAKWYIYDRDHLNDYAGYGENADRMRAIGRVFPVLFFLVAALISLTTMTRMVEEQRTQIGTLKALGYGRLSIAGKYIGYAFLATLFGCIVGVLFGEKAFPYIIIYAYGIMYEHMHTFVIPYHLSYALMASGAALACTLLATIVSCYKELREQAAELMRPPTPKQGKRVLLERIPFVWKRLSFTWKSTIRNLVRYKKRFFMTIFGIGGCMALLLVGFGLKDSIFNIGIIQYEELQLFDGNVILNVDATKEEQAEAMQALRTDSRVENTAVNYLKQVEIRSGEKWKTVHLNVAEDTKDFSEFMTFRNRTTKESYKLEEDGAILTEKMARQLEVKAGDTIYIKDESKGEIPVRISAVCENYLQHYLYMSEAEYEKGYGEKPVYNSIYYAVKDGYEDQIQAVGEETLKQKGALSISYTSGFVDRLDDMLGSLNIVIVVLVISAGMLAFVVLYNLNNINITERKRELATLKVLGFYPMEVAEYVYRENIILTFLGGFAGIVLGKILHRFIVATVEIESTMFGRNIDVSSFVFGFLITVGFSILVNAVMYFKLKKIDMVESLKSVE